MGSKNKIRFRGHESFIIREGWLNKGIRELSHDGKVFFENYGADALGVGPNMAKSIRYWLRCSGLTDESKRNKVELTETAKIILEKDQYFEDIFSLWVVHCNIARNEQQATAWEIFFNEFDYEEFTKEEMEKEMLAIARRKAGEQELAEKSVTDDCDAILRMYWKKNASAVNPEEKNISPFGVLGLLKYTNGVYTKVQPDLNHIPPEIVLYLMCKCMEAGKGISVEELLRIKDGPGKILNLKRTGLVELLEKLESAGKITMNRTAGLDMVYLSEETDQEKILCNYYE